MRRSAQRIYLGEPPDAVCFSESWLRRWKCLLKPLI
ncbi:MAG: hypothetical protein IIB31_05410 [Chloroflexi bacterium]|nr:hypothetical protein [Chloroflexota bacterium]